MEEIYQAESRRVYATLVRLLGDFDLAEDALHDAFTAALLQWPNEGIPASPRAWLVSTGRFKAIDSIRRRARFDASLVTLAEQIDDVQDEFASVEDDGIVDDRLRLIFTCCHPALSPDARIALTLREVCGLTTEEIARAFITSPSTLAQRIVRAKSKIRDARIPYQVPAPDDLPDRLDTVLRVVYLVFNEGYSASAGESVTRADLSGEAIRLARLLVDLLPEPEALGLLALLLLHESRREARTDQNGDLILLDDQDRSLWRYDFIEEGTTLVERALQAGEVGPYTIQAAISAVHAEARHPGTTDWTQIVSLYDVLTQSNRHPSSNSIARSRSPCAMARRPDFSTLTMCSQLEISTTITWPIRHAPKCAGDLVEHEAAKRWYQRALELTALDPERRFLERRIAALPVLSSNRMKIEHLVENGLVRATTS